MISILSKMHEKIQIHSQVVHFIKRFNILALLKQAKFRKDKGVSLLSLIEFLITLVFTQKNLYQFLRSTPKESIPCEKDAIYQILNNPLTDWRLFQLNLGLEIISNFLNPLTSDQRVRAVIFDDSAYSRNRSKKVELLARCKDHVTGKYFKGFRKLTAGWTDGATFIPLTFSLLSSKDPENRLYEQGQEVPKGSPGDLRRKEAIRPGTEVLIEMLDQILTCVQDFRYVLFDNWFSWPKVILQVKARQREVVCMLKDVPTIRYGYQEKLYRLSELYRVVTKQTGKTEYIASVVVDCYGLPVRVVFVRNRNNSKKREWLALLSTDVNLPEEEIIRIYGLRWDIEVYFKMCKSFLRLAKEFQCRSYDSMIAHTTIVCVRYMLLSVENREQKDSRAHGELFFQYCNEVEDLDFRQAFLLIMDLFTETLRENLFLSDEMADNILFAFMEKLPGFLKYRLGLEAA